MKTYITTIALALASVMSSAQQGQPSVTSPDGSIRVYLNTSGKTLSYTVTDGSASSPSYYAIDNSISLTMPGIEQGKYSVSKPKLVSEHFEAPLYKQTSFSDSYNQVILRNKNGINIEFRAYNSGVAYRFFTTFAPSKSWVVTEETAEFNFSADHTAFIPYSTNEKAPQGHGLPSHIRRGSPLRHTQP